MSDVEMSQSTRAMLRGARTDVPSAAARTKIWNGVASAAKIAGGAAAGAALSSGTSIAPAGAASAKTLTLGSIFGGALTVGLALTMLKLASVDVAGPAAEDHVRASIGVTAMPATTTTPTISTTTPTMSTTTPAVAAKPTPLPVANAAPIAAKATPARDAVEDALMREASLLAEARSALARGDAAGALRLVRAARSLPSHQLAPEELALEAQALRALGRGDEATNADDALKRGYPDHALAR